MRLRTVAIVLAAALLAVSVAVAKEGPQSGAAAGAGAQSSCAPKRTLVLQGRFLAGGPESFQLTVTHASSGARTLLGARELRFDSRTSFRRNGNATSLASLRSNDRLQVLARACKQDRELGTQLTARRVSARAPRTP